VPSRTSKRVILFVAANPVNLPPLNSGLEQHEMQEALEWTEHGSRGQPNEPC
jgi:hypothetical protein